jgi:trehalose 6-phosphate synthase
VGKRLVLLSHSLPLELERAALGPRGTRTIGGLGAAIDRTMRARGGTWTALAALRSDRVVHDDLVRRVHVPEGRTFAAGFGNQVLWPLCHFFPARCAFQPASWSAYRAANEAFATAAREIIGSGDVVWVNDFHLALVPGLLRAAGVPARVGLFWHIPFPPPSVFGICPWRTDVLGGLLGADVLGFQTGDDARAFLDCVHRFLGLRVEHNPPTVHLPEREVRVITLPVGVDAERLREQAADPAIRAHADQLRGALGAAVVVLGVDRLDYAKGIEERLRGYERFLERHADWRRRVALVQITVPSQFHAPDYREMKRTIEESVGRILGRFTYAGRPPLAYLYTAFDHEQLAAYYLAADVALVTPLRDGMSLVAKEYVACHTERDGMLVLSEFAGAAQELGDAILVNPYDADAVRRQLQTAISMPTAERRRRMSILAERVIAHDVHWWAERFLTALS